MTPEFVVNHLWQSSFFVLLASGLAFMLRGNSPKVRYWVWLSASLKFLVPWALLVSLGSMVPRPAGQRPVSVETSTLSNTLVQMAEPFPSSSGAAVQTRAQTHWGVAALAVLWAIGFIALALLRYRRWCGIRAMLRTGTPVELPIGVPVLVTPSAHEPGVAGFLKPVLVLPALLFHRLSPEQLDAILAHELSHVRRRDNFFAAVHMAVEAIFWFHPLVWWIGSRMVEERELACDEEVLRLGCERTAYARGILAVCEHYLDAPVRCVCGVTGADIKKRLKAILRGGPARELNHHKKLALALVAVAAIAVPVGLGVWAAPVRAQSPVRPGFDVATIKPAANASGQSLLQAVPGRLRMTNLTLRRLILNAYGVQDYQLLGDPAWLASEHYDIQATAAGTASVQQMEGPMLQVLLEERFKLALHRETRQLPVYELVAAKGGPKLQTSKEGSCTPYLQDSPPPPAAAPGQPNRNYCGLHLTVSGLNRALDGKGVTVAAFAASLSRNYTSDLGRTVIERTGLTGTFDVHLTWSNLALASAATPGAATPLDLAGPSLFTALQDQLGLRIESAKGPVEVLVIDHIEKPSEN